MALNSAVPDFGSVASMVSTFVSTSSGKWSVMKARPGRSAGSMRTGASTEPRRELDPHALAVGDSQARGVLRRQVERLPRRSGELKPPVCTPVL